MKQRYGGLGRFDTPRALLDHLRRTGEDLDGKDEIYRALVRTVQARRADARLATSLLWLGLWPALTGIVGRRTRLYAKTPAELISDIGQCFTEVIERLNFSRVTRIAATLARSTERDVVEGRRRTWEESAVRAELPDDSLLGAVDPVEPEDPPPRSRFGLAGDLPDDDEVAIIRAQLVPIVGDDVDLVIGAAIYGQNQRQLGERLGLTHEVARKRYQRALQRLEPHFQRPAVEWLSQLHPEAAFPP